MKNNIKPKIYHTAKPVSFGIAIGKVLKFQHKELKIEHYCILPESVDTEIFRFENAIRKSYEQIDSIKSKIKETVGEEYSKIFDAHLLLLQDRFFIDEIMNRLKKEQVNAEYILNDTLKIINESFSNLENEIARQRAIDIYDVGRRILQNLSEINEVFDENKEDDLIIVAEELLPSDTLHIADKNIKGIITEKGGVTSHTAILARAMKVPAVIDATKIFEKVIDEEKIILDAISGSIIQNPDKESIAFYLNRINQYNDSEEKIISNSKFKCKTKDGIALDFFSNIELPSEVKDIVKYGSEGIGLFRTEFIFMDKVRLPSENEQFLIYKKVVQNLGKDKSLCVRTLDIGGDKILLSENDSEPNPFLGLRAIRYCLKNVDIFKIQLKAIIRASAFGKIKILIPMVAFMNEINETVKIIADIKKELDEFGIPYDKNIKIGVMIETPAAALIVEEILSKVDFISIGTNDLTQYTLAVDRTNDKVRNLFQPIHPAVLKLIYNTISKATEKNKEVSVCGNMTEVFSTAIILLGMGLTKFSMSSMSIPDVKTVLSTIKFTEAKKITEDVMSLLRIEDIKNYIFENVKPIITRVLPEYEDADQWIL